MDELNRSDIIHIKQEPLPNEDQFGTEERISKDVSHGSIENKEVRYRNECLWNSMGTTHYIIRQISLLYIEN